MLPPTPRPNIPALNFYRALRYILIDLVVLYCMAIYILLLLLQVSLLIVYLGKEREINGKEIFFTIFYQRFRTRRF